MCSSVLSIDFALVYDVSQIKVVSLKSASLVKEVPPKDSENFS